MAYTGYQLAFLFFTYSFFGWLLETVVVTARGKSFANRGFTGLPLCMIYGVAGVLLALTMDELRSSPVFLFLGCMLISTFLEWACAKLLEKLGHRKWWDHSNQRFQFEGYICLPYSLLWGVLGTCSVYWFDRWLVALFELIPLTVSKAVVWILIPLTVLDCVISLTAVVHRGYRPAWMEKAGNRMRRFTLHFGSRVARRVERRLEKAYPAQPQSTEEQSIREEDSLTLSKLFWMFVIGALLGDLAETLFCRLTAGVWMSRSSLVWGPFSVVWGFAIVLATALLHRSRNRSSALLFAIGTFLGGAYEYVCSVLGELVFGAVFWDYSSYQFNLGGRINLLYCFFWGFAAVLWIKGVYPWFSKFVDWLEGKTGKVLTVLLAVFMVVNCLVSVAALMRYDSRTDGTPPANAVEELLDARFDDERMAVIYPNLKHTD